MRLLEGRLVDLHYRLVGTKDGRFDFRTADAVVAFHKVQRMERSYAVSEATWRRLARSDPMPHARHDWHGFHFEVDQTRQVLYTVEDGDITNVLHVSTGAGGATHDGTFRVCGKIAGFSPNHLYYPSYFDGVSGAPRLDRGARPTRRATAAFGSRTGTRSGCTASRTTAPAS